MSWLSLIKTVEAASRRTQREQARVQRLALQQQSLRDAHADSARHESEIEALEGVGRTCGESIDWYQRSLAGPPAPPQPHTTHRDRARQAHAAYQPGLIERLSGKAAKTEKTLRQSIDIAEAQDTRLYQLALQGHQSVVDDFEQHRLLAEEVLKGNLEVYYEVVTELGPFAEFRDIGAGISFSFSGPHICSVTLEVRDPEIVPDEIRALTPTGKLTCRPMPATRRSEIYQDYVCGALFRMARELDALLPIRFVLCSAYAPMLDPATGLTVRRCICTAGFPVNEFARLDFQHLDFSEALQRFRHEMDFTKRHGFRPVNPLALTDFDLSWI